MRYLFVGILVLLFVGGARYGHANGCSVASSTKINHVYYANGILTDSVKGNFAVIDLHKAYKNKMETLDSGSEYHFFLAKNPTQGVLTDIVQVLQQKQEELGIVDNGLSAYQVYQWIQAGLSAEEIRLLISVSVGIVRKNALAALITEDKLRQLADTMITASADALTDRLDVSALHVNYYEADLLSGKRVFIFAHSQGNLFTNKAISDVKNRNANLAGSIGLIGVATPANSVPTGSIYITADDDFIINGLRLVADVLPSNIDNDPGLFGDFRSVTNHFFIRDYFDEGLLSRGKIDSEMERLARNLPYPALTAGDGAIRASLTWGAQPDIDLHVYEPSGDHVYYADKRGRSGYLDVDDRHSYGPENYFVACNDVMLGTYSVGVNYYSGYGEDVAEVSLFLGNGRSVTPRKQRLEASVGSSGDDSPVIVFEIDVSENESGQIIYSVR